MSCIIVGVTRPQKEELIAKKLPQDIIDMLVDIALEHMSDNEINEWYEAYVGELPPPVESS